MSDATIARQNAHVTQEEVGAVYDAVAWFYNVWGRLTESKARNRILELAHIQNGESILELAVGTGVAFESIVKLNPDGRNIGIDLSAGMLEKAKKRMAKLPASHYELREASALALPFDDQSFDLVLNNYMFDLLPPEAMDKVLEEIHRVLKKQGRLVFASMTFGEKFGSGIYERIYRISPRLMGGCRGVQMSAKVINHGFQLISREYIQQMLFPSEVILAHREF